MSKNYTRDWNQAFIKNTSNFIKRFELCLEIGVFEGLTSNYIVDNLLTSSGKLICIDPLTDNYFNSNLTETEINRNNTEFLYFKGQYNTFYNNVKEHLDSGKITLIKNISVNAFPELIKEYKGKFDFIYIDGDHRPDIIYLDGINSFELCKKGGYILFDDYGWQDAGIGIDKFLNVYQGKYKLCLKEYQVLIQKII